MSMQHEQISRRRAMVRAGMAAGAALAAGYAGKAMAAQPAPKPKAPATFRFCLNTATIRGQKVGIVKEIELAAKAGYHAIEPWVDGIDEYKKQGGSLDDLRKRTSDLGISIESAIGFPQWVVEDAEKRAKGLERAKYEMDLVARIGGKRLAAPPVGATDLPRLDLLKVAERYRALLDAGDQIGVLPQLELWGFSKNLNRLGECVCAAIETAHPKACVLADIYHLHKGGSDPKGLALLAGNTIQVFHMNDYPADPPREKIDDSYRTYPGDGVAPVTEILRTLRALGGTKVLSLELFNRKLWAMDAGIVVRDGLAKMKAVVKKAEQS